MENSSYKETFTFVHNVHRGPDREIGDPNSNYNRIYYIHSGASGMKLGLDLNTDQRLCVGIDIGPLTSL